MIKLILIIVGFIVIGGILVGAIDLTFTSDSKLTKIYTSTICDKEVSILSAVKICNKDTPLEIDVDFDKDLKTGVTNIDFNGIERSVKK